MIDNVYMLIYNFYNSSTLQKVYSVPCRIGINHSREEYYDQYGIATKFSKVGLFCGFPILVIWTIRGGS